jgi:hypothetical protein
LFGIAIISVFGSLDCNRMRALLFAVVIAMVSKFGGGSAFFGSLAQQKYPTQAVARFCKI